MQRQGSCTKSECFKLMYSLKGVPVYAQRLLLLKSGTILFQGSIVIMQKSAYIHIFVYTQTWPDWPFGPI